MAVWSDQDIAVLKVYAASGASRARIASRLGRSTTSVAVEARKHGLELKTVQQFRKKYGLGQHWAHNRDY